MIKDGRSINSIAKHFGVDPSAVRYHRDRILGRPDPPRPSFPRNGNQAWAHELFLQHVSCRIIARRLRISRSTTQVYWYKLRARLIAEGSSFPCNGCGRPLHPGKCCGPKIYERRSPALKGQRALISDGLYEEIHRYVPAWIANDLRDDIVSSAYVAILEGRMTLASLGDEIGAIIGKTLDEEMNAFRFVSLGTGDDDDGGDWIADERALEAFDEIEW